MFKSIIQNEEVGFSYFYSTKDKENLHKYFKMKNKHNYKFSEDEENDFVKELQKKLGLYDIVFYPETSGKMLPQIASAIGGEVVKIEKNTKKDIKESLLSQKMMKAERESMVKIIDEMGDDFKINLIKGNQRKRFRSILFKSPNIKNIKDMKNKKVLLLDDSIFSGETFMAMKSLISFQTENIVIFSKQ